MRTRLVAALAGTAIAGAVLIAASPAGAATAPAAAPAAAQTTHTYIVGAKPPATRLLTLAWLPSHKCFFTPVQWETVWFRIDTIGTGKKVWQMKMSGKEPVYWARIWEQRGSTELTSGQYSGPATHDWQGPANGTGLVYMQSGAKRYAKATIWRDTTLNALCFQTLEFASN